MASYRRTTPGRRVQLHRALSKLGWGSRTQAWAWIQAGQVHVDGQVVTDPLTWIDLDLQRITRNGEEAPQDPPFTLALHKPRGIVTTRRDEHGRATVYDLLPPELPWIFPAGRLDADSEGLLILTNDADLAVRLTGPVYHIPKTYQVTISGKPGQATLEKLRHGVQLTDGCTRPAQLCILQERPDTTTVEMVLTEGRNRQIRRMWKAVGHRVRRLVRTAIGGYQPDNLLPGSFRQLDATDLRQLTSS